MKRRRPTSADLPLRLTPWKVYAVWEPIERILHRMEADGTVDVVGSTPVFREDGRGGWYEITAAMDGVIEFHQLAQARYSIPCRTDALSRLGRKLNAAAPIFQADIDAARADIAVCKQQAMRLRASQASDLIETIRVQMEVERLGLAEVAA